MHQEKIRRSIKTLGRKAVCKLGWHENDIHHFWSVPADFRRSINRTVRNKENFYLRLAFRNDALDQYEPLHIEKRNAAWKFW